jgi:hypothetical protein
VCSRSIQESTKTRGNPAKTALILFFSRREQEPSML